METARRLGAFSLVLALILLTLYQGSDPTGTPGRGEYLVYGVIAGLLGLILVFRYRGRAAESTRFSGIKNVLFRSSSRSRRTRKGRGSRQAADKNNRKDAG